MRTFFALLRLQLLSRYADLRPSNWKTMDSKGRRRAIGMAILYVFLVLYLGGMMFFLENRIIDVLMKIGPGPHGMADLLVIMAVSLSMVATLLLAFFFILSSLYLGRDSAFLASMPIKTRVLLAARMTQVWISETLINAALILPACLLFGIRTGQDAGFYLRMVLVWLFGAMMPISIGSVVATLLARVSMLLKHREALLTIGGLALMVGYMMLSMSFGSMTSNAADGGDMLAQLFMKNEGLVRAVTKFFPPAAWAVNGLQGNWGQLLLFMFASVASMALIILVLGIWYRKLSLMQAETPTVSGKKGIQKGAFSNAGSPLRALMSREIKQILRVPSYATNILPVCFMPVIMTVMMLFFIGKNVGDNGENLTQLLTAFDPVITMPILAAIMAFAGDMNPALSTAVTREGRGHPYMIALPVSARTHIFSKMAVGYTLSAIGAVLSSVILMISMPSVAVLALLALVLALVFVYGCSCLALARDIKKPRLDWVTEQEAVKQSFGVLVSLLIGWAGLGILGLLTYLLIDRLHLTLYPLFAILLGLLAVYAILAHRHLMRTGEKYYFRN